MCEYTSELKIRDYDVAIIGMAGRFPDAENVSRLWENIKQGHEAIRIFSDEEILAAGVKKTLLENPDYVKAGTLIEGIDEIDADFFNLTPSEAALTDPQHRLFLETAWNALESAGYSRHDQQKIIGVFGSTSISSYLLWGILRNSKTMAEGFDYSVLIGNDKDFLCTRVAYKLNLNGPALTVQTACSGSLVAVHLAWQSLVNHECDLALAGGTSVLLPQKQGYLYKKDGILSKDGHCRTFDNAATGTVKGDGTGVVVLKLAKAAIRDNDTIYAIIKSTAINNDGSSKIGFTAPGIQSQCNVIREAIELAEISPEAIGYVETHGTGTAVGDPIEIRALTRAFESLGAKKNNYCSVGTLKPNIGHLDTAAGVTGLIKAALCLKHNVIPPSINYRTPNKEINFENSPFYVNTELKYLSDDSPLKYAGVSAFGLGGTNAHVVLQKAPEVSSPCRELPYQIFPFSGKTEKAVNTMCNNLLQFLKKYPNTSLAHISYTLCVGKEEFDYRYCLIAGKPSELAEKLAKSEKYIEKIKQKNSTGRKCLVLLSGLVGSAENKLCYRELYQELPCYEKILNKLLDDILSCREIDLKEELFSSTGQAGNAIIFIKQYAFLLMLLELGVQPSGMYCRNRIDDYIALVISGALDFQEALGALLFNEDIRDIDKLRGKIPCTLSGETGNPLEDDNKLIVCNAVSGKVLSENAFYERLSADVQSDTVVIGMGNHFPSRLSETAIFLNLNSSGAEDSHEITSLLDFLGAYWSLGFRINWDAFFYRLSKKRIPLPTYPFEKKSYWISPNLEAAEPAGALIDTGESIENQIIAIWEYYLGHKGVKRDDDYFTLGGDSLMAVKIVSKMQEQFKVQVSMHELINLGNPAALADFIGQKKSRQNNTTIFLENNVALIKKGTLPVPLFCIHPAGGTIYCFYELSKYLLKELPVYGLQFPVQLLADNTVLPLRELADCYLQEIRKIQKSGPYLLCGYSSGGNFAYEIALQLEQAGEKVLDLMLFDSHPPEAYNTSSPAEENFVKAFPLIIQMYFSKQRGETEADFHRTWGESPLQLDEVIEQMYDSGLIPSSLPKADARKFFNIWKYNHLSIKNYFPDKKLKSNLIMFRAKERESEALLDLLNIKYYEKETWERYTAKKLIIHEVPGDHYSLFGDNENVRELAASVCKVLNTFPVF